MTAPSSVAARDDVDRSRLVVARVLGATGLVGAVATVVIAFAGQVDWGPPGTDEYRTYELVNRLIGGVIGVMIAAPVGLWLAGFAAGPGRPARIGLALTIVGLVALATGSMAEFWLFSSAAYGGPGSEGRNLAFLGFLLGALVCLIGAVVAGIGLMRSPGVARRVGGAVFATVPLGIAMAFAGAPPLLAIPLAAAAMAGGTLVVTAGR